MIINTINLFRKPVSIIYIQGLIFFTTFRFVNFTTTLCGFETYCIVNILLYAIRYYNKTLMPWKNSIMSSWVLDEEKLLTVDQNYIRESLSTINTYFIYINKNYSAIMTQCLYFLLPFIFLYIYSWTRTFLYIRFWIILIFFII